MPHSTNLIVACAENRVIGRDGLLPWRIAEDWKFFKQRTARSTVILGRISYQSWRSILEDEREVVVVSRNTSLAGERVRVAESLASALRQAQTVPRDIFICGGQRIFEEALNLPQVTRLYVTLIHANVEGDRFFPEWRAAFPRVLEERSSADENFRYTFYVLGRAEERTR